MHYVDVAAPRPDIRVFIDLLYGPGREVDAECDTQPVSDRMWTRLLMRDRSGDTAQVTIRANEDTPSTYRVQCASQRLEELAALYLFLHCGRSIWTEHRQFDEEDIDALERRYEVELRRAADSIWSRPT